MVGRSRFPLDELAAPDADPRLLAEPRLWAVSPFSRLAIACSRRWGWKWGVPSSLAIWTLPFLAAFVVWFATGVSDHDTSSTAGGPLPWTMLLAASWIVLGPCLMFVGEVGFGRTLGELDRTRHDGWQVERLSGQIRRINQFAWVVDAVFIGIVLLAFLLGQSWLRHHLAVGPTGSLTWFFGLIVLVQIGFSSGFGVWGAGKAVFFVWSATRSAGDGSPPVGLPPWSPFRPDQAPGVEALAFFSTSTACIFSAGSVMAPAIAIVASSAPGAAPAFLWASVVILILGSTALFLLPTIFLRRLTAAQRAAVLTTLAREMEAIGDRIFDGGSGVSDDESRRIALQIEYWRAAKEETAHPHNIEILRRLPVTTILPVMSALGAYVALLTKG